MAGRWSRRDGPWAELSIRSSRATAEYLYVDVSTSLREQGLDLLHVGGVEGGGGLVEEEGPRTSTGLRSVQQTVKIGIVTRALGRRRSGSPRCI